MKKYNNEGVTLIALVVTIIVLLIIAGVTIGGSMQGVDESKDQKALSELKMVQHAVLERYTSYSLTKDEELLVGTKIASNELDNSIEWKTTEGYYRLNNEQDFNNLGIAHTKDTYIVNYSTGEVYNETVKKTSDGKTIYIYAVNKSK